MDKERYFIIDLLMIKSTRIKTLSLLSCRRFSLLLLEPNEIYFEDFLANLIDEQSTASDEPVRDGHLKMCSKSIIFDPKDKMEPILKIVYKDCKKLYEWPGKLDSKDVNVLAVECSQYTEMLERNFLAPYTFKNEKRTFLFSMQYARIEALLQHLSQLHRASSLQPYEQNDMVRVYELLNFLTTPPELLHRHNRFIQQIN